MKKKTKKKQNLKNNNNKKRSSKIRLCVGEVDFECGNVNTVNVLSNALLVDRFFDKS